LFRKGIDALEHMPVVFWENIFVGAARVFERWLHHAYAVCSLYMCLKDAV